eukprot:TRINITY_DN18919_c0_g1_i6.p1 TRINITY_DN18919_c0_g1~~TRINITY_DN18919_c0_g1_i6.p1  ORF type:complete len:542 (+),score=137.03 TRINITY_DN18919_c0_g1_i6:208-1833(+)
MRWLLLLALAALSLATPHPEFTEGQPEEWMATARAKARERLAMVKQQARVQVRLDQVGRARAKLAGEQEREAARRLQEKRTGFQLRVLERNMAGLRKQEHGILQRAVKLERMALRAEKLLEAPEQLGEARVVTPREWAIRAAEMKGRAARWRRLGNRWKNHADRVKAALQASAQASVAGTVQMENDKIVATAKDTAARVQTIEGQAARAEAKAVDRVRASSATELAGLEKELHAVRGKLSRTDSQLSTTRARDAGMAPSLTELKQAADQLRVQLQQAGFKMAAVVRLANQATAKEHERPKVVWPHSQGLEPMAQSRKDPKVELAELDRLQEQIKHKLGVLVKQTGLDEKVIQAHQAAAGLLANSSQDLERKQKQVDTDAGLVECEALKLQLQLLHANKSHTSQAASPSLGESPARSLSLAAIDRAERKLKRVQKQQRRAVRLSKKHAGFELKHAVELAKGISSQEAGKLRAEIRAVRTALAHAEAGLRREKLSVRANLIREVSKLRQDAMQLVEDEAGVADLSDRDYDAMKAQDVSMPRST